MANGHFLNLALTQIFTSFPLLIKTPGDNAAAQEGEDWSVQQSSQVGDRPTGLDGGYQANPAPSPFGGGDFDKPTASALGAASSGGLDNPAPFGNPAPSPAAVENWSYEDDEGGFPAGFVMVLLALAMFAMYRRNQARQAGQTNCARGAGAYRGGAYQPVSQNYKGR